MTYEQALALAKKIKELSPSVLRVELFGSVLHNGRGRDADFLIVVDEELAKTWWHKERELIRVRWPDALYSHRWIIKKFASELYAKSVKERRQMRLEESAQLLGIRLEELKDSSGEMPDFEMFLAPSAWRIGKEINKEVMGQVTDLVKDRNTFGFLSRIAKDATPVA
jgi:predicted nucleotidyltransferase